MNIVHHGVRFFKMSKVILSDAAGQEGTCDVARLNFCRLNPAALCRHGRLPSRTTWQATTVSHKSCHASARAERQSQLAAVVGFRQYLQQAEQARDGDIPIQMLAKCLLCFRSSLYAVDVMGRDVHIFLHMYEASSCVCVSISENSIRSVQLSMASAGLFSMMYLKTARLPSGSFPRS